MWRKILEKPDNTKLYASDSTGALHRGAKSGYGSALRTVAFYTALATAAPLAVGVASAKADMIDPRYNFTEAQTQHDSSEPAVKYFAQAAQSDAGNPSKCGKCNIVVPDWDWMWDDARRREGFVGYLKEVGCVPLAAARNLVINGPKAVFVDIPADTYRTIKPLAKTTADKVLLYWTPLGWFGHALVGVSKLAEGIFNHATRNPAQFIADAALGYGAGKAIGAVDSSGYGYAITQKRRGGVGGGTPEAPPPILPRFDEDYVREQIRQSIE